jgi:hypothetical protein
MTSLFNTTEPMVGGGGGVVGGRDGLAPVIFALLVEPLCGPGRVEAWSSLSKKVAVEVAVEAPKSTTAAGENERSWIASKVLPIEEVWSIGLDESAPLRSRSRASGSPTTPRGFMFSARVSRTVRT